MAAPPSRPPAPCRYGPECRSLSGGRRCPYAHAPPRCRHGLRCRSLYPGGRACGFGHAAAPGPVRVRPWRDPSGPLPPGAVLAARPPQEGLFEAPPAEHLAGLFEALLGGGLAGVGGAPQILREKLRPLTPWAERVPGLENYLAGFWTAESSVPGESARFIAAFAAASRRVVQVAVARPLEEGGANRWDFAPRGADPGARKVTIALGDGFFSGVGWVRPDGRGPGGE